MTDQQVEEQRSPSGEPRPSRPRMPADYGIPEGAEGMLPWSRAEATLEGVRTYWIATTRPDGRPHAIPLWGVWIEGRFYCDGHPETRWARNLMQNPAVALHIEHDGLAVMVEGVLEDSAPDAERAARIEADYDSKYSYHPDVARGVWTVRPKVAFAWDESLKAATRWHFEGD